jgi:hypothetical protein
VFLEWVEEGGERVGFKYRSSQGSTDGIGDRAEYFAGASGKDGAVDPKRMYFCRLHEAREAITPVDESSTSAPATGRQ